MLEAGVSGEAEGQRAAGGGGGNANGANAQALQAEIERLFPFTPNQPFEVTFECSIGNVPGLLRSRPDPSSGRDTPYYIEFHATPGTNQTFALDLSYELDDTDRSHLMLPGTYAWVNGQIRIDIDTVAAFPTLAPFPLLLPVALHETSTRIDPHLGLVGYFETRGPNPIACRAIGHRYNAPPPRPPTRATTRGCRTTTAGASPAAPPRSRTRSSSPAGRCPGQSRATRRRRRHGLACRARSSGSARSVGFR